MRIIIHISTIFTGVLSPFVMAADFSLESRTVLGMMNYQYEEVFLLVVVMLNGVIPCHFLA
jgi:hypothetical protein